jgi:hypothetical protein
MILRSNIFYDLNLLSREHIWVKIIVWFIVLKSICGGSLHRVARHAGTDIKPRTDGLCVSMQGLSFLVRDTDTLF